MEDWLEYIKHALDPTRSSMDEQATREWIKNNPVYFGPPRGRNEGMPYDPMPREVPGAVDLQRPVPRDIKPNTRNYDGDRGGYRNNSRSTPITDQYDEGFIDYLLNGPAQQGGLR